MSTTTTTDRPRHCLACGYRVDNLSSRACPECGSPFDLSDDLTTSTRGRIGALGRWLRRQRDTASKPSRWILPASLFSALAVTTYSLLSLGAVAAPLLYLCFAFVAITLPYLPRRIAREYLVRQHGLPPALLDIDRRSVRRARLAFLSAAALVLFRVPLYLVLLISLPSLTRVATHEYAEVPHDAPRPHDLWIGLFPVDHVDAYPGGVTFTMRTGTNLHYLPGEIPEHFPLRRRHWLLQDWYTDDF